MKQKFIAFTLLFSIGCLSLPALAQSSSRPYGPGEINKSPKQKETAQTRVIQQQSPIQTTGYGTLFQPQVSPETDDWQVSLTQRGLYHANPQPKSYIDSIKHEKTLLKLQNQSPSSKTEVDDSPVKVVTPVVNNNFIANAYNNLTPPDNDIAVSDNGTIVSVTNSRIMFLSTTGTVLGNQTLANFFSPLSLTGTFYDPMVIWDPTENKFILIVLSGNSPSNTHVCIAFSSSSDPTNSWWLYDFDGDPLNNNVWFDRPTIGVSTTELYVSGNCFDINDSFQETLIYQIDKANGFTGGTVNWITWNDVQSSGGFTDFHIVPISYGFDGSVGPGIFFVSSNSGGGTQVEVYWTTNTIGNSPMMVVNGVSVNQYTLSGNAAQLGSTDVLDTGDTRVLNGFYASDHLHFVLGSERSNGWTGIYYGRVNIPMLTATTSTFGLVNFDYTYPAVMPFTNNVNDKSVLIGFLRSSSTIYPQMRVVNCDDAMTWSSSVLVKGGESFVDILAGTEERWGDYSGIAKRHVSGTPEVWVSGCYGDNSSGGSSDVWGTWVGQINPTAITQAPVTDFSANQTSITAGDQVNFTDLSTNQPTDWSWTFSGGSPASSSAPNPQNIQYNNPGSYNVSLTTTNSAGSDTETKSNYIMVNMPPPVANFSASQTTIDIGDAINFTDLSTNSPSSWNWSFQGGSPANSTAQNPQNISYTTPGTYSVTLTVTNSGGNDTEVKAGYITVNNLPPVADFSANNTSVLIDEVITFTDLSTNSPVSWNWDFPEGSPTTSTAQNPQVSYIFKGVYTVTLTSNNSVGSNTITKTDYITVDWPTAIEGADLKSFKLYPNPVTSGRIKAEFSLDTKTDLDFFVLNQQGQVVKHLLNHRVKAGENSISFQTDHLANGVYYLLVQSADHMIFHKAAFEVMN